jgi:uncharacterized protein (DUF4415 family)
MDCSAHRRWYPQYGAPDDDIAQMTEADDRRACLVKEAGPARREAAEKLGGRPRLERPKVQVTLRLNADLIEILKAQGQGRHSRINNPPLRAVKRRKRA